MHLRIQWKLESKPGHGIHTIVLALWVRRGRFARGAHWQNHSTRNQGQVTRSDQRAQKPNFGTSIIANPGTAGGTNFLASSPISSHRASSITEGGGRHEQGS